MVCLSGKYHFRFLKGCLLQILFVTFLNTLSHISIVWCQLFYVVLSLRKQFYLRVKKFRLNVKTENTCGQCSIYPTIRPKLRGNCAFPQNFHTRKLGAISVFYAVLNTENCFSKFHVLRNAFIEVAFTSFKTNMTQV